MDIIKHHFFFFRSSLADTLVDGSGASIDTSVKGLSCYCGAGLRFDSEYSLNVPRSGTFFRFLTPLAYLEPALSRCRVFPFFSANATKRLG